MIFICELCYSSPCAYGCPHAPEPKKIGYCYNCEVPIREDFECYEDRDNNLFCSTECALEYYEVKEKL